VIALPVGALSVQAAKPFVGVFARPRRSNAPIPPNSANADGHFVDASVESDEFVENVQAVLEKLGAASQLVTRYVPPRARDGDDQSARKASATRSAR